MRRIKGSTEASRAGHLMGEGARRETSRMMFFGLRRHKLRQQNEVEQITKELTFLIDCLRRQSDLKVRKHLHHRALRLIGELQKEAS